jgi:hypothetical protein
VIHERLDAARRELRAKSHEEIELKTAVTWGARAVAAYEMYCTTGKLRWLVLASGYAHEALEHGADGPAKALGRIRAELKSLTQGVL